MRYCNYEALTDEEIVLDAKDNDNEEALVFLINKYRNFVRAKARSYFLIGADPERGVAFQDVDLTGPVVIVIGDEGEGMAHLTRERCDSLVRIPMRGKVQSLNASVASAILLYELLRQRGL